MNPSTDGQFADIYTPKDKSILSIYKVPADQKFAEKLFTQGNQIPALADSQLAISSQCYERLIYEDPQFTKPIALLTPRIGCYLFNLKYFFEMRDRAGQARITAYIYRDHYPYNIDELVDFQLWAIEKLQIFLYDYIQKKRKEGLKVV